VGEIAISHPQPPDPPGSHGRVTCVVADRQAPILRGVCDFLESRGIAVVGRAQDGHEALAVVEERQPTVAIVDPHLRGIDGIEIAARVSRSLPGTGVIVYADARYRELLLDALEAGARGFVAKDAPLRDLVRAIEMVCDGRYYVNVRLLGLLADQPRLSRSGSLTKREADLLRLVVNGARGVDVVRSVDLRARDVPRELTSAMAKLDEQRVLVRHTGQRGARTTPPELDSL
jgi:DNA-binding NarL/FixJ family response regulator